MNKFYKLVDAVHKLMYQSVLTNILIPETPECTKEAFIKALNKCCIHPILLTNKATIAVDYKSMAWDEKTIPQIKNTLFISDKMQLSYTHHFTITEENSYINNNPFDSEPVLVKSLKDLLFCIIGCPKMERDDFLPFGHISIPLFQVFYMTPLTYCTVNLKPFVPGHILVIPRRNVPELALLTEEEATDLMLVARRMVRFIRDFYHVDSTTITIQDGPLAGQTIPDVHIHIMPRKFGDFEHNDDVYEMLDNADIKPHKIGTLSAQPDADRKPRSKDDMTAEATAYINYLKE